MKMNFYILLWKSQKSNSNPFLASESFFSFLRRESLCQIKAVTILLANLTSVLLVAPQYKLIAQYFSKVCHELGSCSHHLKMILQKDIELQGFEEVPSPQLSVQFNTVSVKPPTDVRAFSVVTKIQSWIEATNVFVKVYVDRIPRLQQNRAVEEGHVCLFSSPSWTEPLLGGASLSSFSRCVSMGSVWGKMDFLHVLSEYLHQRKLIAPLGGGQWCLLMLPLRQSPMTNSLQTEEDTDAMQLLGWFQELVNPNCHQCWQGPHHTDTVSTPAGTKLSMPSQSLSAMFATISLELLPAVLSLHWKLM